MSVKLNRARAVSKCGQGDGKQRTWVMTSTRGVASIVLHSWCEATPNRDVRDIRRIPTRTQRVQHEGRSNESDARSQALAH